MSEVKCRWPFRHISIDVYGNVRPCCAWELEDSRQSHNINTQPLADYLHSDMFHTVTQHMRQGQYAPGCRDCYLEEQSDMPNGTRNVGFDRYQPGDQFALHDMEIKFGNLCNQGCIMCSPMNSSVIAEERERNSIRTPTLDWHKQQLAITQADRTPWYLNPARRREVCEWAAQCRGQVMFRGGEPTVNNHLTDFLQDLADINPHVRIFVNTNGLLFGQSLCDQLMKFDDVDLEVSIDGYGTVNDYVRWPSQWHKLEKNVDRMIAMPNTRVKVSTTVHALNVGYIQPLCAWVDTKPSIDSMHANVVWFPDFLRPALASPRHIQNFVDCVDHYSPNRFFLSRVVPTLTHDFTDNQVQELRVRLTEYLADIDRVRGLRWQDHVSF